MAAKPRLVDVILSAGKEDMDEIDGQIELLERELEESTAKLKQQIDALKAARRLIAIRTGAEPARKPRQPREEGRNGVAASSNGEKRKAGEPSEAANRIFDLLSAEGSMPVPAIAERIGSTPAAVGRVITAAANADWFEKRGGEVHIARG